MKKLGKKLNGDLSMPSAMNKDHNFEKLCPINTRSSMGFFEAMAFIK
jgi:hypothetical protein